MPEPTITWHDTAAPTAVLTRADGHRTDRGCIVTWWYAELVVHAHHPARDGYPRTWCGWPAPSRMIPLGHALRIGRPCRVCWTDS